MHEIWHVAVLGSTLFGAAGAAILALSAIVFDDPPPGLTRARPLLIGLIALASLLVAWEWLVVH